MKWIIKKLTPSHLFVLTVLLLVLDSGYAQTLSKADEAFIDQCVQNLINQERKNGGLVLGTMIQSWRDGECRTLLANSKGNKKRIDNIKSDWSVSVEGKGSNLTAMAFTKAKNANIDLIIKFRPSACNHDWFLVFKLTKPNHENGKVTWIQKIQIDSGKSWNTLLSYQQRIGDELATFALHPADGYLDILDAMRRGSIIKLSLFLADGKNVGSQNFSLSGFTLATETAYSRCVAAAYDAAHGK